MRLRLLGPSGLRVSELCLGTMTFGEDWGWGASKEVSRQIFDAFAEAGGNFIDTANNYTNGTSETIVGECLKAERERYVVATKYTLRVQTGNQNDANLGGNSRRSLVRSVEKSLQRLDTDYLDLLYLHMWDYTTSVEEVLQTVQQLVLQGKLLYFAFSDTPAWVVASALAKAEAHGWPKPVGVQVPWSLLDRGVEREVLPMARANGLAVLPWGLLESGTLTGKYSAPSADEPRRQSSASETELAAGAAVVRLAGEIGRSPAQVALNWVRQQPGNIIPILGARTVRQLQDNLGCLDFRLTDEQLSSLAQVARFNPGFPNGFLHSDHVRGLIFGKTFAQLDQMRAG
jgi:aryl-alcohol dehydrogenase-like predicted oxidoreductase